MSDQYKAVSIPPQPGSQYTNEQRIAVIADHYVTGNISKTADMHNIPRTTIDGWIKSRWGAELLVTIRQEKGEEFDANVTRIIDSAFEETQDRIKNGDFKMVKVKKAVKNDDGSVEISEDYELRRQPMTGKDLALVGGITFDKRQLHRNQPTAIRGDNASIQALADEFRQLARDHDNIQNSVVALQKGSEENA